MNKQPQPTTQQPKAQTSKHLRLPFEPRKSGGGWAVWLYRHRIGMMVTIVVYLSLSILFMTYRIILEPAQMPSIEIEFSPEEIRQIEQIVEQQKEIEQMQAKSGKMQNKISDENSKFNSSLRDHKNTNSKEIYEEAQRVVERVNAGREEYSRSLSEMEKNNSRPLADNSASTQSKIKGGSENRDAFVKGNVAASFNLEGRTADYLDIPAYKCEGGGQVVVVISVNQNGRVISASVDRATSTSERCLLDEAVASAKASRFSASGTAPNPQHGTITYTFVPQ